MSRDARGLLGEVDIVAEGGLVGAGAVVRWWVRGIGMGTAVALVEWEGGSFGRTGEWLWCKGFSVKCWVGFVKGVGLRLGWIRAAF